MINTPTLTDYIELQNAMLERLNVISRNWAHLHNLTCDPETGEISVLPLDLGRYMYLSSAQALYRGKPLLSSGDVNRPLLYSDLQFLDSLLVALERDTYSSSSAFWVDPSATDFEGEIDLPRLDGIPCRDALSGNTYSPYNWPEELVKSSSTIIKSAPQEWIRKLGFSYRPKPSRYTPDNDEWFAYATAFVKSLRRFAIKLSSHLLYYSIKSATGSASDAWNTTNKNIDFSSFAAALANAKSALEDANYSLSLASPGIFPSIASLYGAHVETVEWGGGVYSIGDWRAYLRYWSAGAIKIKEGAALISNLSTVPIKVELWAKAGSKRYGVERYDETSESTRTSYVRETINPFTIGDDGYFHKIGGVEGTVNPGEYILKKLPGSDFETACPDVPPGTITGDEDSEGGLYDCVGYPPDLFVGKDMPYGTSSISYGALNGPSLTYWIITPEFSHFTS